jgi:hypothetical protein
LFPKSTQISFRQGVKDEKLAAFCLYNKKGGVKMTDENNEKNEKNEKKENNMVWVIVVVFIAFFAFVAYKKMTGH